MRTKHSLDLTTASEKCFALTKAETCKVYGSPKELCGTHLCPFYKPEGKKTWVRIEDEDGINLLPPEEVF